MTKLIIVAVALVVQAYVLIKRQGLAVSSVDVIAVGASTVVAVLLS